MGVKPKKYTRPLYCTGCIWICMVVVSEYKSAGEAQMGIGGRKGYSTTVCCSMLYAACTVA